ncbi:MAG: hypothetical protein IKZ13_06975 [Akkermansia sp.]|nr:hypothetical protein [Bacteroidaceae bacterium]MBR5895265.1 hypothetical protein [Akkermansia sp.]
METENQDELKSNLKIWLKANNHDYAWLAEKCYVSEATVRNWMARKPIPAAKVYIINEIIKMKEVEVTMPSRVQVEEETRITMSLDSKTRRMLERKAFAAGKTLGEYLSDEVSRLSE